MPAARSAWPTTPMPAACSASRSSLGLPVKACLIFSMAAGVVGGREGEGCRAGARQRALAAGRRPPREARVNGPAVRRWTAALGAAGAASAAPEMQGCVRGLPELHQPLLEVALGRLSGSAVCAPTSSATHLGRGGGRQERAEWRQGELPSSPTRRQLSRAAGALHQPCSCSSCVTVGRVSAHCGVLRLHVACGGMRCDGRHRPPQAPGRRPTAAQAG